jgi:hypothetical protein
MSSKERFRKRLSVFICTVVASLAVALSCRQNDRPSPISPLLSPDSGSPTRPPNDDTTTGHPIGPISQASRNIGGFDPGGTGGAAGTGGSTFTGGIGGTRTLTTEGAL